MSLRIAANQAQISGTASTFGADQSSILKFQASTSNHPQSSSNISQQAKIRHNFHKARQVPIKKANYIFISSISKYCCTFYKWRKILGQLGTISPIITLNSPHFSQNSSKYTHLSHFHSKRHINTIMRK